MVQGTMMAVVKARAGRGYDYTEVPAPSPKSGEVLLRIRKAAICGTDILVYKWGELAAKIVGELPFIPGHECVADVVEVGQEVQSIAAGDRVCAETHIPCEKCYQCTHGMKHICRDLVLFGHQTNGCFAEYAVIPARAVYKLRTDLPDEQACLLEPFGVSLRGVEEAHVAGETLLVTGCGPIGVFAVAIARHMGAARIIVAEPSAYRREFASHMGADVVLDPEATGLREAVLDKTAGDGAGCVIECSGAPDVVSGVFSCLRKGGTIVQLGNPKGPLHIENVLPDFMQKELTLRTLHGRRMFETWETAEELLADGKINIAPAITHTFPMSRIDDAMRRILDGEACKVELEPDAVKGKTQ